MSQKLNLLDSLIKDKAILVHQEAKTWQEAVKISTQPLVTAKIINDKYYQDIIESTAKHGPYYVIMPGLAMPHASATEDSVFGNGFSLITLKEPVVFENGFEVSVLICIAAIDGETHTQVAIPQIVAVFEDPENITKIAQMNSKEEIIEFIRSIDYAKYLV
ncbi:PTS sugar transporter subunit IIA [Mycoplasmopsis sturni]|uniref:PTS sugar transporter subunit IIA n=1 Tax=Mycoplasmopsis sturni TaxID=39047 RepID=UPI00056CDB87|nr:PTS sugar transporter subunit IIA [Mycoplasmopsis sturni]